MKKNIITYITGFLMAIADSVPGVSGGTICYITGRYEQFISSLNTVLSFKTTTNRRSSIYFLIKIGIGWIFGMIGSILVISSLLHSNIYDLSSLFLGFICFSIPYIIIEEKNVFLKNKHHLIYTLIGALLVFLISKFSMSNINIWSDNLSIITYIYILLAGVIAISSMLLPGISGSTILLIFGLYIPIIGAVKDVIKFNFSSLNIVIVFALGIVIGMKNTSSIISNLFKQKRSMIVHLIIGLMIGSIYSIIVGPTTLADEITDVNLGLDALSFNTFNIYIFLLGILSILSLDLIRKRIDK